MQIPALATCAEWAPDGSKVVLGLRDGRLAEVQAPRAGLDVEKTYEVRLAAAWDGSAAFEWGRAVV